MDAAAAPAGESLRRTWRCAREAAGSPCDGRCRAALDPDRCRLLALLRRHGRHASSFQVLGPGFGYWFDEIDEGAVAYAEVAGYRVAAGPPIAPRQRRALVAGRFVNESLSVGRRVLFFGVGDEFLEELRAAPPACGMDALPIGVQAEFEPAAYTLAGRRRRSMRAQVHRAHNHGVRVRRVQLDRPADREALRDQVETVLGRWLAQRRMGVLRFVVDVHPFVCETERRYYLAERGGSTVGFLAAVPVYARDGWFLEDLIRAPGAPNGTNEALIHAALEDARVSGDSYATLGLAPLAGLPRGPGPHRLLRGGLRAAYRWLGALYGFEGLFAFKRRMRPERWAAQHLVACPPRAGLVALGAVLRAFSGGGLLAFARDSLARAVSHRLPRTWGSPRAG
jgi:phosphatidylglycerol lysyltransferase